MRLWRTAGWRSERSRKRRWLWSIEHTLQRVHLTGRVRVHAKQVTHTGLLDSGHFGQEREIVGAQLNVRILWCERVGLLCRSSGLAAPPEEARHACRLSLRVLGQGARRCVVALVLVRLGDSESRWRSSHGDVWGRGTRCKGRSARCGKASRRDRGSDAGRLGHSCGSSGSSSGCDTCRGRRAQRWRLDLEDTATRRDERLWRSALAPESPAAGSSILLSRLSSSQLFGLAQTGTASPIVLEPRPEIQSLEAASSRGRRKMQQ